MSVQRFLEYTFLARPREMSGGEHLPAPVGRPKSILDFGWNEHSGVVGIDRPTVDERLPCVLVTRLASVLVNGE